MLHQAKMASDFFIGNITVEVMNHDCSLMCFLFKDPMTCECVSSASVYRKRFGLFVGCLLSLSQIE